MGNETGTRNRGLIRASIGLTLGGLMLTVFGLVGTTAGVRAGDPEPLPRPDQTPGVSEPTETTVPPTNTPPGQTIDTPTATTAPPTATDVPATNTSVPPTNTSAPPTATGVPPTATNTTGPQALVVASPTQVVQQLQGGGVQGGVTQVGGVSALPRTGAGDGASTSWLMVAAGGILLAAGAASLALERRRG